MTEDFGISPDDKQVLDRLRSNRDAKLERKNMDADTDKIEPTIIYGIHQTPEQRKAKQHEYNVKINAKKKAENQKAAMKANAEVPTESLVKTSFHKKGTMSPDIITDSNGNTLLKWTRYIIHDNTKDRKARMLNIPKQISFDGCVEVCYNTKSKVMTITPQESNIEAT